MKQKFIMYSGTVLITGILLVSFYGIGKSLASSDYEYEGHQNFSLAKQDPLYVEECGSCHMAYPPQLLPSASWQKIMHGLEDHFGENAELDDVSSEAIGNYLTGNRSGSYRKMLRNLGSRSPIRITELPYFIHEHDEIPSRFIQSNDKVSSLSQCNACHQKAERGQFDEDNVYIPGVGRWDD